MNRINNWIATATTRQFLTFVGVATLGAFLLGRIFRPG